MPQYTLDHGHYDNPPFIFYIDHNSIDLEKFLGRESDSWYPKVFVRKGDTAWFEQMEKWKPYEPIAELPTGVKHFLVHGHDSFIELLAGSFSAAKEQKM